MRLVMAVPHAQIGIGAALKEASEVKRFDVAVNENGLQAFVVTLGDSIVAAGEVLGVGRAGDDADAVFVGGIPAADAIAEQEHFGWRGDGGFANGSDERVAELTHAAEAERFIFANLAHALRVVTIHGDFARNFCGAMFLASGSGAMVNAIRADVTEAVARERAVEGRGVVGFDAEVPAGVRVEREGGVVGEEGVDGGAMLFEVGEAFGAQGGCFGAREAGRDERRDDGDYGGGA